MCATEEPLRPLASRLKTAEFEKHSSGLVPIEIHLRLHDGTRHKLRVESIKGSREKPLSEEEMVFKFKDCTAKSVRSFSQSEQEALFTEVSRVLENDHVSALAAKL